MKVKFHPHARDEVREARKWYYERSPVSAMAFTQAVENAVSIIVGTPSHYPLTEDSTRRFVLQRFPFNIYYLLRDLEIIVVAVAHQKRRPGYWASRVTKS